MDECDISAETAAKYLKADIEKARGQAQDYGTRICVDCGYVIEAERKKAVPACTRCLTCQTEMERIYRGNN